MFHSKHVQYYKVYVKGIKRSMMFLSQKMEYDFFFFLTNNKKMEYDVRIKFQYETIDF